MRLRNPAFFITALPLDSPGSACLQKPLQTCTFVFNHFQDAPPATSFSSSFCIVAGGWHRGALLHLVSCNAGSTLSPLFATHPGNHPLTKLCLPHFQNRSPASPLFAALPTPLPPASFTRAPAAASRRLLSTSSPLQLSTFDCQPLWLLKESAHE